ncbi:MAG: WbuC family cupin fold metalloprotein [Bacteroidales bacterium]|nr:WbuC family cupin fold metalloprotein [Bacteroidales bacterium]
MQNQSSKFSSADVVVKTNSEFSHLKAEADVNIRKRTLQTLHSSHEAELHSMINVFTKGSYTAPHVHWVENESDTVIRKGESFIALEGEGKIVLFSETGEIDRVISMNAAEQTMVWIPAGVWHSVVCISPYFIVFENKTGPWKEGEDKLFHPLFPKEGDSSGDAFVKEWESL